MTHSLEKIDLSGITMVIGVYPSLLLFMGIFNAFATSITRMLFYRHDLPSMFTVRLKPQANFCRSESEFSFSVIQDVTVFGFQQKMMAFLHGIEYKNAVKTIWILECVDVVSTKKNK